MAGCAAADRAATARTTRSRNERLLPIGASLGTKHSAVMPSRGDLREDGERDFRRVAATEVEADRPMEPADLLLSETRFDQPLAAKLLGLSRADDADVGRVG